MAEEKNGKWVTLENGTHLFIKNGQTLDDAIATLEKEQPTHKGETSDSFDDDYDFDNWDEFKEKGVDLSSKEKPSTADLLGD